MNETRRQEAELWFEKHVCVLPHLVIVGLGEGHHVDLWMSRFPECQLTVIETRPEFVESYLERRGDLAAQVEFVVLRSDEDLLTHPLMARLVHELPSVFCFQPGFGGDASRLQSIFRMATGRSYLGLSRFMKAFGFDSAPVQSSEDGRFLTVKDLGVFVDTQQADHPRAPLVRVLRELIA